MGYYINPSDRTKENFLLAEGTLVTDLPSFSDIPLDERLVCLVDNGAFTAAGIVWSERELEDFSDPTDPRPRQWFSVPRSALDEYLPADR